MLLRVNTGETIASIDVVLGAEQFESNRFGDDSRGSNTLRKNNFTARKVQSSVRPMRLVQDHLSTTTLRREIAVNLNAAVVVVIVEQFPRRMDQMRNKISIAGGIPCTGGHLGRSATSIGCCW